jgi:hypothetical protein
VSNQIWKEIGPLAVHVELVDHTMIAALNGRLTLWAAKDAL